MYAKIRSGVLQGIEARDVFVETVVAFGFPAFTIVGLPDAAIRESRDRVRMAIRNAGFSFPDKRVTVNLSPADIRKEGAHLDLPIALSILKASGYLDGNVDGMAFFGELALDGRVTGISGALPLLLDLPEHGIRKALIPEQNRAEAGLVKDVEVYCAGTLQEVVEFLCGKRSLQHIGWQEYVPVLPDHLPDFGTVSGQEGAKRALQIAAAGMHNVLMTGSPGSGKTMLARCVPSIMPPMSYEESREVSRIYSACGLLDAEQPLIRTRPFRSPDHTISPQAMIGGGRRIRPGEVSLAHLGVLFLDELPEFSGRTLEALRKPVEDEVSVISRLSGSVTLPAKFLLIGAMNPCPCGFAGWDPAGIPGSLETNGESGFLHRVCTCTPSAVARYRRRLSGPFLDRFDIFLFVSPPGLEEIRRGGGTSSADLFKGVCRARAMQNERFGDGALRFNSQIPPEELKKYCPLDKDTERLLEMAYLRNGMSMRAYNRVIRTARTIADLEGRERIRLEDAAEAISYRKQEESW